MYHSSLTSSPITETSLPLAPAEIPECAILKITDRQILHVCYIVSRDTKSQEPSLRGEFSYRLHAGYKNPAGTGLRAFFLCLTVSFLRPNLVASVAGVWNGRERGFGARGAREEGGREGNAVSLSPSSRACRVSLAHKTPFPFPFKRLPRRLKLGGFFITWLTTWKGGIVVKIIGSIGLSVIGHLMKLTQRSIHYRFGLEHRL